MCELNSFLKIMAIIDIRKREKSPTTRRTPMMNLFSLSKTSSNYLLSSSSSSSSMSISRLPPPTPSSISFSQSMMEENIEIAESIISKWDLNTSSYTKFLSLFQENRKEAKDFIKSVNDLRRAMHFLVSSCDSGSDKLVLAQNLMQIAMKRLEKEFYLILSANRECLDPESVSSRSSRVSVSYSDEDEDDDAGSDDEVRRAGKTISNVERLSVIAMSDLRSIADCMISSGYGKECAKIYKIIRKSIVEESLYRLGIERYSSSQINKMNSEVSDNNMKNWLNATKIAVKMLFHGERFLCDHVFSASETIRESCFTDISKEGAMNLFKFAELVAKSKRSPEKIFRLMDMYEAISDLWPDIESIFSYVSVSEIRLQALSSLHKLAESVQTILTEFESSIQKNSSKTPISGGGIHLLTNSVMNYIQYLANYSRALGDIIADSPSLEKSPLPELYIESPIPAVTGRLAWIILVLLCKLDSKAEQYNDIALSYVFLTNNLQFVVEKVRTTNLKYLLGDEWISKHEQKVRQYAANYESMTWSKVLSCLPENPAAAMSPEMVKQCFRQFNSAFEMVYRKQTSWVVIDGKLRDEIKVSIAKQLVPEYRNFYEKNLRILSVERNLVRFAPEDLSNYLSDLFNGSAVSGSSSFSSSSRGSRCLPSI